METIKLQTVVDTDGVLRLTLPTHFSQRPIEVLVIIQPLDTEPVDALGYPVGYFEETYGMFADNPIERGEQPPYDIRDEL